MPIWLANHILKHLIRSLDLTFTELKIPELRQFPDGIWSLKHLKAAEYEELLFQLPFAMEFANFPKSLITIPVAFLLRFSLLISRTKLKISEIREMEKEAINIQNLCDQNNIKDANPSDMNTLKIHETFEYSMFTMIFESGLGSSCEAGERSHLDAVSIPYSRSNKKNLEEFIWCNLCNIRKKFQVFNPMLMLQATPYSPI